MLCKCVYEDTALKGVEVTIGYVISWYWQGSSLLGEQIWSSAFNKTQIPPQTEPLRSKHTSTEPTAATEMCPSSSGSSSPAAPSQNKRLCNLWLHVHVDPQKHQLHSELVRKLFLIKVLIKHEFLLQQTHSQVTTESFSSINMWCVQLDFQNKACRPTFHF